MKTRLDALLRQRELLRQHAQWLDDEIAAERARTGVEAAAPLPKPEATAQPTSPPAVPPALNVPAEADVKGLHNEVRRGCLLYFFLAFAILAALVAFIYWKYDRAANEALEPPPTATPDEAR